MNTKMDISSRKYAIIEQIMALNEQSIIELEEFVKSIDTSKDQNVLIEKMTTRVHKAEEDAKEGRVMDSVEFRRRLKERMGL